MTALYLGTWEAGSPEWLAARQGRAGGSDVSAILGLSPWQSPFSLWNERKGLVQPDAQRKEMTWGNRLEPVIIDAYRDNHPDLNVHYSPGAVYAHADRPWQVCSPDALTLTRGGIVIGGIEAKSDRYDDGFGKDGTADIPPYYACQVQWCMDVFGVDEWHVAALFTGSDYREYRIQAQPIFQQLLREEAKAFLDSIDNDAVPPIDSHDQTYQTIRRLNPAIEHESEVELETALARRYIEAIKALSNAEAEMSEVKSLVADFMGRAKKAMWGGKKIAYRRSGKPGTLPYLTQVTGLLDKFPTAS